MASYVTLYDPKEHVKTVHQCDLPNLRSRDNQIWWRTIVECEECAQKWVAMTYKDHKEMNKWVQLKWYHFKLRRNLRR
jgi:hypothetical protein